MEFFDRIINGTINSLFPIRPNFPYFPLISSVILYIINSQKSLIDFCEREVWYQSYDYIVIGAGSAGSVMASRLSEDITKTVLLIEAGMAENVISNVPRMALFLQKTPIDWQFITESQDKSCLGLKGRRNLWSRGKVMGGSSVLNAMLYSRGNSRDYDNWAANGATGWSWADIFPYFIKAEDNRNPSLVATGYHGVGGPLTVTDPSTQLLASEAFLYSGPDIGYSIGDTNGPIQSLFTLPQRTIRNGERLSVAKAYLQSIAKKRPNLHILKNSFVTKIHFNHNKRAIGVEFFRSDRRHTVFVKKEVVLSAGTVMSPKLLMLSGIGPSKHLKGLGIDVISDLPVGNNLQDHVASSLPFSLNDSISINIAQESSLEHILEYYVNKNNSLSSSMLETMAFVKTKYANQSDDWPDIQLHVFPTSIAVDYGLRLKDIQGLSPELWKAFKPYSGINTITILPTLLRPKSRGWIRLRSTNPFEHPIINPNFFSDESDLDVLVEGMKIALKLGNTPSLQRYNATPFQTTYPGCERYKLYSTEYLRCMCQTYTSIFFHPMGTCKMGSVNDRTAVVDTNLRVKGVTGLRVVDASVIPSPISGNINSPIVAIAEKIADHMKGRRLKSFVPPMTEYMIKRLPELPFEHILY